MLHEAANSAWTSAFIPPTPYASDAMPYKMLSNNHKFIHHQIHLLSFMKAAHKHDE